MPIAYSNAILYTGHSIETRKAVLVENGTIVEVVAENEVPSHYSTHDLSGKCLAPALIDLQIYGGNGRLFSQEITLEALQSTYEYCLAGGCSHFMITMATNTIEKFLQGMELVRQYQQQGGKGLLGLHLEGPYMNPVKRGAHLLNCIKKPTTDEVKQLIDHGRDVFKMITLAPEQCDSAIIKLLLENNIIISAGHSNANYQQAMAGFDLGIQAATHLFNAMSPLQHREPGMVGAIFNNPSVMASIVCDGIHVDYAAVKIAKTVLQQRLFFITDAVAETTTGEYQHLYKGDHYALPDGTLSGSALTMMQCVKNGVEKVGIPLEEALRMASTYPAQLLKGQKKGLIAKGYQANMVVFDESFQVHQVIG
ncbi:N-acetylglucosamine-6-phosphate deacetylase [Paraflavitalea sp. CAU 1676]|uniref:N-acetylglucosamine-6-phosphate deacetylase n=1 Tax=Paraflavitalea sp. CAU 1676 TaxID=3032598 RepID=UPI0023D9A577|nr:N-acetylglucosamine-6-phosphate deacetylase [Paraflavitalea sp. CAU 1676]MDF2191041.1 N-acetylglucosamine-6-phosphate deacetylase [Paraflavitalea sp. CAU 1676]